MAVQAVPYALQNASHSAALFRQSASAPFATGGILSSAELTVSQQGTPNMSVVLGPGRAKIPGTSVSSPLGGSAFTTQAMYDTLNDANLTLTVTTANATNPRIDAVYIQVQDAFYSGATNTAIAGVVAGVPAASPVAPAVPSNSILIAYLAVGANVTTIITANITYQAVVAQLIPSTSQGLTKVIPTSVAGTNVVLQGGTVLVASAGGATIDIRGVFTTATKYRIEIPRIVSSGIASLQVRLMSGSTVISTSTYDYDLAYRTGTTPIAVQTPGAASLNLGTNTNATKFGWIELFYVSQAQKTGFDWKLGETAPAGGGLGQTLGMAFQNDAVAYDGIEFLLSTGTFSSAEIAVYAYS